MKKAVVKKAPARKATAKKANAPMKNDEAKAKAPAKSPRKEVRAAASKAARATAKAAGPGNRKSAAKRTEKAVVKSPFPAAKTLMNRMTKILREDCAAVACGKGDEKCFVELVQAVTRAVKNNKKKHGIEID